MSFQEPFKVYVADNNIEAILVVNMLSAGGVIAYADEDQSGVSIQIFGSSMYKPNVWIDKSMASKSLELIRAYEDKKREQGNRETNDCNVQIDVECEECGKTSEFAQALDGTTQECRHCHAYVDVGELDWDEDFGEPEE